MIGVLVFFLVLSFLCLCYSMAMRIALGPNSYDGDWDDVDETITTTTTTTTVNGGENYALQGNLHRYYVPHLGYCVRDPIDGEEVIVQASDDRYEDAGGKIWAIV